MAWHQVEIRLKPRARGFHLVTGEIVAAVPELARLRVGVAHIYVKHTSASLTINENADPDVRADLERWCDRAVPEGASYFEHTAEGADDMPAHVKASLLGSSVSVPIRDGRLALGTWQGVYLGEHRDHGGSRTLIVTLQGEAREP
jgi:secondary thiamine-phosphate synthase enzyme